MLNLCANLCWNFLGSRIINMSGYDAYWNSPSWTSPKKPRYDVGCQARYDVGCQARHEVPQFHDQQPLLSTPEEVFPNRVLVFVIHKPDLPIDCNVIASICSEVKLVFRFSNLLAKKNIVYWFIYHNKTPYFNDV